jgi:hypothetical protein
MRWLGKNDPGVMLGLVLTFNTSPGSISPATVGTNVDHPD